MSDLTATNCGCGCNDVGNSNCGCGNMIWIIILLFCCNGSNGIGGCGNGCDNNNGSCLWILILLFCCNGNGFGNCGC